MDQTKDQIAEAIQTGDKNQFFSLLFSLDTSSFIAVLYSVLVKLFFIVVTFYAINTLLKILHIEWTIPKLNFTLGGKGLFNKKGSEQVKVDTRLYEGAIKESIVKVSEEVMKASENHYRELSNETKIKLKSYIAQVIQMYKTTIEDNYTNEAERGKYLSKASVSYLRELMCLASFEDNLTDKVCVATSDLIEQKKNSAPEQTYNATREQITEAIKTTFQEVFICEDAAFNEAIDGRSAEAAIKKMAKEQVFEILRSLERVFDDKQRTYDALIEGIQERYSKEIMNASLGGK